MKLARVIKITTIVALGLGPVVLASAAVVDEVLSAEVLMISPKPPEVVRVERQLWEQGQPVAEIYGVPAERPVRVVLPDQQRLIRPEQDPKLLLLQVDKAAGENPLQVKTVWFVALRVALALSVLGIFGLVFLLWLDRRWRDVNQRRSPRASVT
jgi:hypothetical protein